MAESSPDDVLSWENLIYLADLLLQAGERSFRILGGEPTLHPDFNNMVLYLLERGFDVQVYSNGIMSEQILREAESLFAALELHRLSFVCNVNDPVLTATPLAETEAVGRFLSVFGNRTTPGFNIYRTDFTLDFIFDLINRYGTVRKIRMGVAHPIVGRRNKFIQIEDLDKVIDRLFSHIPQFERFRVNPILDCGFPLCRFSDEQLAWMYRYTGGTTENRFLCGPVVDIGPDMTVWPCFPLSSMQRRSVFEFNNLHEINSFYQSLHEKVKHEGAGIYDECDICVHREQRTCYGGCLAHNISKYQEEEPVRMEEVYL
jgi:radical SAM protein with 4Fe4S-binding SPASM domain